MRSLLVILGAVLLAACAPTHDYLGEHYAPTREIVVYYPHQSVPPGYAVMGTNTTEARVDLTAEQIVEEVVLKAEAVGADAVALGDVEIVFAGTTHSTDIEHDEYGYTERHRTSDRRVKVLRSTFLRRTDR